jgi:hypothetical protein
LRPNILATAQITKREDDLASFPHLHSVDQVGMVETITEDYVAVFQEGRQHRKIRRIYAAEVKGSLGSLERRKTLLNR